MLHCANGQLLTTRGNRLILLNSDDEIIMEFVGHSEVLTSSYPLLILISHQWVRSVCAMADGRRVVSASYDTTLRVWDVATGECERVLEGHTKVSEI